MNESLYNTLLPGSAHWSLRVRRGMQLRFTDQEGGANLSDVQPGNAAGTL